MSHIGPDGRATMVDVSGKGASMREATAEATIAISADIAAAIADHRVAKGEVLRTAEIAGLMAAKRVSDLIPLCHPLPLDQVTVAATLDGEQVTVRATARTMGRTGVEMEAMTAASIAALTIYDMVKGLDKGVEITTIRLIEKKGGKSGHWTRV